MRNYVLDGKILSNLNYREYSLNVKTRLAIDRTAQEIISANY